MPRRENVAQRDAQPRESASQSTAHPRTRGSGIFRGSPVGVGHYPRMRKAPDPKAEGSEPGVTGRLPAGCPSRSRPRRT